MIEVYHISKLRKADRSGLIPVQNILLYDLISVYATDIFTRGINSTKIEVELRGE